MSSRPKPVRIDPTKLLAGGEQPQPSPAPTPEPGAQTEPIKTEAERAAVMALPEAGDSIDEPNDAAIEETANPRPAPAPRKPIVTEAEVVARDIDAPPEKQGPEPSLQECNARYLREERERRLLHEENIDLLRLATTRDGKRVLKNLRADRSPA